MNNLSKILSYSTLGTLCAFLLQLTSVKILSIYDYGIIAKWLTDLAFLSVFFVFGLDNSLLFFSKNNNDKFNENFYRNIFFFSFICFLLMMPAIFFNSIYYISLVLSCYILAIIQSFNSFNQLNERFSKYGITNLSKNLFIFLFFFLVFILNFEISYTNYLIFYLILLFFTLLFVFIINYKPKIENFKKIEIFDKSYFIYGSKSMLNTFLAILLYSVTIYILDIFLGKEEVGLFFAASVLAKLAWVIPDSVGNLLYPKFLKINIKYSKEKVMKETYFYAQLNFLLNIIAIVLFFILGKLFINIFYGVEYKEIFYLVIILLIGNQGMVYYKILGRYFAAINEWRIQRVALIFSVIFNIILNLILIPILGIVGAALSTALAFWLCGIIMALHLHGSFIGFINLKMLFGKLLNDK
ncbi:oligosaccharide flippase family protein [Acinetobacter sp. ANC 3781]